MPTIQIKEAKLISNKYEKLLWSVSDEESSKIRAWGGLVNITEKMKTLVVRFVYLQK